MHIDAPERQRGCLHHFDVCFNLEIWPAKSNQDISRGQWLFPVSFVEI